MNKTGKIKTFSFISLDGYVSKMGGGIDWLLDYPRPLAGNYGFDLFAQTVGCAVLNGIYYATLQACDLWPHDKKKSYVILPKNATLAAGVKPDCIHLYPEKGFGYVEAVDSIRRKNGGDIWLVGDHEMLSAFMERGLIDEITLNVIPVTLGNGYPLFNRSHAEQLWQLEEYKSFDNGVMQMRYVLKR